MAEPKGQRGDDLDRSIHVAEATEEDIWPNVTRAAALFGVSVATASRWAEEAKVGTWRRGEKCLRPRDMLTLAEQQGLSLYDVASDLFALAREKTDSREVRGRIRQEINDHLAEYQSRRDFTERVVLLERAVQAGAERMPEIEGLLWTRQFSVEDRQKCLDELLDAARATTERGPSGFNAAWKGWEESAEIMADPVRLARLTKPAGSERIPLPRP